jgi:HK97 gp10 family phage protein
MQTFNHVGAFIAHLATLERKAKERAKQGLKKSAKLIEKTAKAEIGNYQPAVGPYRKWEQLADSTLAHHDRMGVGDSPLMVTGQLYASIQHEVEDGHAVIGSTMEIAKYQEFGTDRIPARPFMGPALYVNKEKIRKIMGAAVFSAVAGNAWMPEDD